MKKSVVSALTLAAALLAPAGAYANPNNQGCKSSDNKPRGCDQWTTVAEPGDLMLLSTALAGLGAFSFLRRKRQSKQM
jgi:hypothetical protein